MGPLALAFLLASQAPATLADYLKAHPEDSGLAIASETTAARTEAAGLGRYGRKLVHLGGVAAVVPLDMIRFEETPTLPPNLYDGLPRDAKVLCLMSTLDMGQWQTAAGRGIGLSDLRDDQRAVFRSLLPKRPYWREVKVSDDHGWGPIVGEKSLDEKGAAAMRLRIEQSLQLDVQLVGEPRGSTAASPSSDLGEPGETVPMLDTDEDDEGTTAYGVAVRATVPNVPKKGQLDTSTLNARVALPARTTVGEALALLSQATGREFLADIRVRGLSVAYPGGKARAGDLLDALALGVAGTYRRVDGTYLLVADVVGAGARKLRHVLWKESIDAEVERRKATWKAGLAKTGLALNAGFPDDPLMGVTPAVKREIEAWTKDPLSTGYISSDELSPQQRELIDRTAARAKDRTIDRSKVHVQSSLRYRFVLPDGRAFQQQGSLGSAFQYAPHPPYKPMGPDPAIPMAANPEGALRPLVVRLNATGEAAKALAVAKTYGFTELWVETDRPEALKEAVAGGLPTRLFVRPWALPSPRPDSDTTVLGETGRTLAARQAASPAWAELVQATRDQSYPRLGPRLADGDLMSPWDPAWPARRNAVVALAQTPGLAGVVIVDPTPRGYEGREDSSGGQFNRPLRESGAFGYHERARLAFFRKEGYDPVDLTTEELRYDVDTDTPTFPRYPARPLALVREAYDKWTAFRAKPNLTAINGLRNALGDLPVLVEVRRTSGSQPPRGDATLAPWPRGEEAPTYEGQFVPEIEGALRLVSAPDPKAVVAMTDFGNAVKRYAPLAKASLAVDLTHVPLAQWDELLRRLLVRK